MRVSRKSTGTSPGEESADRLEKHGDGERLLQASDGCPGNRQRHRGDDEDRDSGQGWVAVESLDEVPAGTEWPWQVEKDQIGARSAVEKPQGGVVLTGLTDVIILVLEDATQGAASEPVRGNEKDDPPRT